jgi:two-component system chemotaxis response regulator CheY
MRSLTLHDLTILLVEPSATQKRIITSHLEELGVTNIDSAENARDALERMTQITPDLVISAMHLPDMTGTELLQTMRSDSTLLEVPYMLISSETDVRYLEPMRQAGVVAILPKPYDQAQLKKALFATLDFLEPDTSDMEDFSVALIKVLIVDDSYTSRHQIKRVLNKLGIEQITEAENGRQGADLIQSEYFDLVVTDYYMPEMDGEQFTQFVREKSNQPGIPILMITSEQDNSRLASVQQSGISALCDKPFEPEAIKNIVINVASQSAV